MIGKKHNVRTRSAQVQTSGMPVIVGLFRPYTRSILLDIRPLSALVQTSGMICIIGPLVPKMGVSCQIFKALVFKALVPTPHWHGRQ